MSNRKRGRFLLKLFAVSVVLLLAAGLYFVYDVLPGKIARTIASRAAVRCALTRTPGEDGFSYQSVTFPASGGITLSGWWMPAASGRKPRGTILLSHGAFHNRQQVLDRAEFLVKKGYQVLLFDLQGCGLSGPSPLSGGVLESGDYLAGMDYLRSTRRLQKPVVFFGFSLGAMSALRAAARTTGVDAVIADSPLANLRSYVSRRTVGGAFSRLPGFLDRCLKAYDRLTGLSLKESDLDLKPVVEKLHGVAVLYITGEGDNLAKSGEVKDLFEHTGSRHRRLVYLPDAGHEETFSRFPMIYIKMVDGFLSDLSKGFPEPKGWEGEGAPAGTDATAKMQRPMPGPADRPERRRAPGAPKPE